MARVATDGATSAEPGVREVFAEIEALVKAH